GFADSEPTALSQSAQKATDAQVFNATATVASAKLTAADRAATESSVRAWDAALPSGGSQPKAIVNTQAVGPRARNVKKTPPNSDRSREANLLARSQAPQPAAEYVTVREEFFLIVRQGPQSAVQESWQVHYVAINVMPAKPPQKP